LKCFNCGAEIPEASRYCLSCGMEVPGKAIPQRIPDPEKNMTYFVLFALAFAMFFFALIPVILGSWEGAALLVVAGIALAIIALLNVNASRRHAEKVAELQEKTAERMQKAAAEANARLKCRYCGALNDRNAPRCVNCGGTL